MSEQREQPRVKIVGRQHPHRGDWRWHPVTRSRLLDLQQRIQDTNALIAQMQRSLKTPDAPPSVIATMRSLENRLQMLEDDFRALAERKSLDVCSYRMFSPTDRFKLSGFAKALADFQTTFSLTYDALKNGPKQRARITPEIEAETSFDFAYAFSGSVGVVMTLENERLLLGETFLDETMSVIFEMIDVCAALIEELERLRVLVPGGDPQEP